MPKVMCWLPPPLTGTVRVEPAAADVVEQAGRVVGAVGQAGFGGRSRDDEVDVGVDRGRA